MGLSDTERLALGDFVLERHPAGAGYDTRYRDQPIAFTRREFAVLWTLASQAGKAFERRQLLERAWGLGEFVGPRTVDAHVVKIRRKLGAHHVTEFHIETIWGIGYRLQEQRERL